MFDRARMGGLAMLSVLALGACTSIPRSTMPESRFGQLSCPELDQEVAKAGESRRVAAEARGDAWHVLLPLLVAARYVSANQALSEAEGRATKLQAQQASKGCVAAKS